MVWCSWLTKSNVPKAITIIHKILVYPDGECVKVWKTKLECCQQHFFSDKMELVNSLNK